MRHRMQPLGTAVSAIALAVALCTVGCASLVQPYPTKNLFVISTGGPSVAPAQKGTVVLRVQTVRIAKPYDEKTFIYKTGESAFTVDYYNGFIADPGRLLTGELTSWLARSGLFAAVVSGGSVDHDLTLETNVTALYGDYSAKGAPKAVLEVSFVLIRERGTAYTAVFQDSYREVEPVAGYRPEQLIQGWERAYSRMLEKLTGNLRTVVAPATQPAV